MGGGWCWQYGHLNWWHISHMNRRGVQKTSSKNIFEDAIKQIITHCTSKLPPLFIRLQLIRWCNKYGEFASLFYQILRFWDIFFWSPVVFLFCCCCCCRWFGNRQLAERALQVPRDGNWTRWRVALFPYLQRPVYYGMLWYGVLLNVWIKGLNPVTKSMAGIRR